MNRHRLTDDQWECIQDLFSKPSGIGRPRNDPRHMLDCILWVLRTGSPWRDLPPDYGHWSTAWDYFDKWNADGTLAAILQRLIAAHVDVGEINLELWLIDGTIVRAARCAAGGGKNEHPEEPDDHGLGRSRGGFSTKIHLVCDDRGHPLSIHVTGGQVHEASVFEEVMDQLEITDHDERAIGFPKKLAGDKGYRADRIDEFLIERGIQPVIPSRETEDRSKRPVCFETKSYRARNIIERLIGWLKECRRMLTRFEKTAINYCGMIRLAIIQRYLRQTAP